MPSSRRFAAALAVATGLLAACGTRLPDTAFVQAQAAQQGQTGTGPGQTPAGPGQTGTGPGQTPAGPGQTGTGPGQTGTGPGQTGTGPGQTGTGPGTGPQSSPGPGGGGNTASDVGVTATSITIGNIVSKTNPFDPRAFVGPAYGLEAFVKWTNAHGGLHGRQLVLKTCDDQGSGDANVSCVHQLIDRDHVFALVSNAILTYSGADYVNGKGVPDIAGQPIDTAYDKYPHLWEIYGDDYPRDGKQVGFHGYLYGGTEVYRFFKKKFPDVPLKAGVVEYDQSASQRFGDSIANGLRHEGYDVDKQVVNFALPDYDSVAIDFKNNGVKYVYDTIDRGGNVRLCKALDDHQVDLFAKVVTTQSWEQSVRSDYSDSPSCRNHMWATGTARNYADTKYEQVAEFRQQMAADGHGGSEDLSDWALEGWAGGVWFADAALSCGADLTRACVEKFMGSGKFYGARGLIAPARFNPRSTPEEPAHNCINVVRWLDSANGWVTQVPDMDRNCFDVPEYPYK